MKPRFITFTGADDNTSIEGMIELSRQYPIEWALLLSPKRQGEGRYPSLGFVREVIREPLAFAAHLCGGDAREVIESGYSKHDFLIMVDRVQINTADPHVQPTLIAQWADSISVKGILQCREQFPEISAIDVLFDASGGRGIEPKTWPKAPVGQFVGYAGGLNPSNVTDAVSKISAIADNYWIDMETGVRTDDRFDLDKCRAVCEAVYGKAHHE